jgi:NitT/TauT family transport system permease protein
MPGKSVPLLTRVNRWFRIREMVPMPLRVGLGILPILALLGLWVGLTSGSTENRVISPVILPSPLEVLRSFHSLWFEAELSRSIVASAGRVVGGFLVAIVVALPLGILMGSFSKVQSTFDPLVVFGGYLPIPTLVPLTMSLFGIGETQKIMFLAIAFLVFLLPMFVRSLRDVDDIYLRTAETLGASKAQLVRHVLVGVAAPRMYDAMRLCFGIGWTYIVLAEMVAADRGLGHIIIIAQRRGPREHIYLVLVVIVLLAYLTDKVWMRLGRILFPYRESE